VHKTRLIARIDVKNEFVIKGIHLEGLRKIGNPIEIAKKYYEEGIDEILFMDAVASLYGRNNIFDIINKSCKHVFVPITIGGGIRCIEDIEIALKSGADKIAINTQAIKTPQLIKEASRIFGSQCIVGSIEAKKNNSSWEAYINNGRDQTSIDAIEWAQTLESLGIGELLITSIDMEGTKKGFDNELINKISSKVNVPIISCGGAGNPDHISTLKLKNETLSGVALASILHYNTYTISQIKNSLFESGIQVRI
jgi:cyclase